MTAIPLILLLTFVGLVVHVKDQSESAQVWALHSAEVMLVSQSLLARIAETESAVRAYVITGDDAFVASYETSWALIAPTTTRLRSPGQRQSAAGGARHDDRAAHGTTHATVCRGGPVDQGREQDGGARKKSRGELGPI